MKYFTRAALAENTELGQCLDWCFDTVGPGNYVFEWSVEYDDYIFYFERECDLTAFRLRFRL